MLEVFIQSVAGVLAVLAVIAAFNKASSQITGRIEALTSEVGSLRKEVIDAVKRTTVVEANYVTAKQCSEYRENGSCGKH